MADFPYAQSPEKLANLLKTIPTIGKPEAFETKKLKSLGFTSSHDSKLLNVLKFLGLIEDKKGGSPTDLWQALRTDFGGTLAQCIRDSYSELFGIYPNAHTQDTESLRAFFTANTSVGADTVQKITSTFQTLVGLADFNKAKSPTTTNSAESATAPATSAAVSVEHLSREVRTPMGTININIQLQLPSDPSGEVYDKLFRSLSEHIWSPRDASH